MHPANIDEQLSLMASPDMVRELERHMLQLPQIDLQTEHLIHGGMYARTIFIPAGTVLTGALTNCDNICVMVGDISVTTDDGTKRLVGHHVLPAAKGFKRAGIAHGDTYWTTILKTDAMTIEDAERHMTDEADMLQTRREGIEYAMQEHIDFSAFMLEKGLTPAQMQAAQDYIEDLTETDECFTHLELRDSPIHGKGLFARHPIAKDVRIAPAQIDGMRAVAGRRTNHSHLPNAYFVRTEAGGLDMHALRDIEAGEEVTIDYRQALRVNNFLEVV